MSDRLKELQRQRAIVHEQLARLDREIAAINLTAVRPDSLQAFERTPSTPSFGPVRSRSTPATAVGSAEEIMTQFQTEARSLHVNVRRGCLLYFFLALGLLALGVFALYFFRTKR